jgi:hypothetical protein
VILNNDREEDVVSFRRRKPNLGVSATASADSSAKWILATTRLFYLLTEGGSLEQQHFPSSNSTHHLIILLLEYTFS